MDNNSIDKTDLLAKYKLIDEKDESISSWTKILELKEADKSSVDWYSSKTFEAFLDALDIDQPSSIHDKNKQNITTKGIKNDDKKINNSREIITAAEKQEENISDVRKGEKSFPTETILSAEALKILSELPDLSHMSTTRTFMFPGSNRTERYK